MATLNGGNACANTRRYRNTAKEADVSHNSSRNFKRRKLMQGHATENLTHDNNEARASAPGEALFRQVARCEHAHTYLRLTYKNLRTHMCEAMPCQGWHLFRLASAGVHIIIGTIGNFDV